MFLTKATYSMISGAVVNVLDYGAVADGNGTGSGTDSSTAIQNAIDAVVATGKPGTVYIPGSSIYRCDSGLTLDLSLCSIVSDGATLDFTNMPGGTVADYTANGFGGPLVGVALTVTSSSGYAGGAFYEATQRVQGLRLKGKQGSTEGGTPPAPPNDQTGIYFYGTTYTQTAALFQNVCVSQFYQGAIFGENEFGSTWIDCTFIFTANCIFMPQVNNAGERNTFIGCKFYNSANGLILENAFATSKFISCSIGGMSACYTYITRGFVSIISCHYEGNFAPDYPDAIMIWNDDVNFPDYSFIDISDTLFLAKTQRNNPIIRLDGACEITIKGGYIDGSTAGSAALIGGNSTSAGGMRIYGAFLLVGTNAAIDTAMGIYANHNVTIDATEPLSINNVVKAFVQSAAPTTGTWVVGDMVYNSNPAPGGYIGWICTTAGTPGTWKTFGSISV